MLTRRIGSALIVVARGLLTRPATAQTGTRIGFLAAPKDHGVPGRHEYVKNMTVLAYCLRFRRTQNWRVRGSTPAYTRRNPHRPHEGGGGAKLVV